MFIAVVTAAGGKVERLAFSQSLRSPRGHDRRVKWRRNAAGIGGIRLSFVLERLVVGLAS
jgi:hypothetical protein